MPSCLEENPRKILLKQARLKGMSKAKALKQAGYAKTTAEHVAYEIPLLKLVDKEIMADLTAKDITVDYLLKECQQVKQLALNYGDFSNASRNIENQAKFVGIDKQGGQTLNINIVNMDLKLDDDQLTRLARRRQSSIDNGSTSR
jgi:hypothetical protein